MTKALDLVAIGRAGVDLYGQQIGGRLEDMASFAKYVGGSPTNTAIGLARLGQKSALLTRVGADHMGRFIRETLERAGLVFSGVSPDEKFVEMIELPRDVHPWFVACQFHPEYKSKPLSAHPLFTSFVRAAHANRLKNETSMETDTEADTAAHERLTATAD